MNYNIKNRKLSLKEVQKILIKFKLGLHAFANIVQPDDQQKQNCISTWNAILLEIFKWLLLKETSAHFLLSVSK